MVGWFVEVMVVMWLRVHKGEVGEGVGGRKPKMEPWWWREVEWLHVGDNSGRGAVHLQAQGGRRGWGAENPKPSVAAWFWATSGHWEVEIGAM